MGIVSASHHCACQEDMVSLLQETSCCNNFLYAAGLCNTNHFQCISESECMSQEGQTCIRTCQAYCHSLDGWLTHSCMSKCLGSPSSCSKYLSCRPPSVTDYICGDGRFPNGASGCCHFNGTDIQSFKAVY